MGDVILLVHDDISTIAAVRRLLARGGYEVVLATSAADAVIAFNHHLPSLILLAPSIEGGRGRMVLDELAEQRERKPASVLLLGEPIPEMDFQVVPLPLDGNSFLEVVSEHMNPTVVPVAKPPAPSRAPPVESSRGATGSSASGAGQRGPPTLAAQAEAAAKAAVERADREIEAEAFATLETALSQAPNSRGRKTHREPSAAARDLGTPFHLAGAGGGMGEELARVEREKNAARDEAARLAKVVAEREEEAGQASALAQELAEREKAAQETALRAEQLAEEARREVRRLSEELVARTEHPQSARAALARVEEALHRERELREQLAQELVRLQRSTMDARDEAAEAAQSAVRQREASDAAESTSEQSADSQEQPADFHERAACSREQAADSREPAPYSHWQADFQEQPANFREQADSYEQRAYSRGQAVDSQERTADLHEQADSYGQGTDSQEQVYYQQRGADSQEQTADLDERAIYSREQAADSQQQAADFHEHAADSYEQSPDSYGQATDSQEQVDHQQRAAGSQEQPDDLHGRSAHSWEQAADSKERAANSQEETDFYGQPANSQERAVVSQERATDSEEQVESREQADFQERAADSQERSPYSQEQAGYSQEQAAFSQEEAGYSQSGVTDSVGLWSAAIPNGEIAQLPAAGTVAIWGLGQLLVPLCVSGSDVRLDLRAPGVLRSLWLRQGMLVAAHSSLRDETVIARARRDGLITSAQENEVRAMKSNDTARITDVLMSRKYLRESEILPLLQRYYESIALNAVGEAESRFQIASDLVPESTAIAPGARPALHLFCEALRRALNFDEAVGLLGSLASIPVLTDAVLRVGDLGFSDREREFIEQFDGTLSAADGVTRSGFPREAGARLLAAASILGALQVRVLEEQSDSAGESFNLERLEAKFQDVQNGDYFSILGLSKTAGAAEVQRAFGLLSAEFHPLRFALHPDPTLQQRAQHVHDALLEAASVLQDDRLRSQYVVNLLD